MLDMISRKTTMHRRKDATDSQQASAQVLYKYNISDLVYYWTTRNYYMGIHRPHTLIQACQFNPEVCNWAKT